MKILITGVFGFIGQNLYHNLKHKYDVKGIGRDKKISKIEKNNSLIVNKITYQNLINLNFQPDVILHCAGSGSVSKSYEDKKIDFDKNVITTKILSRFVNGLKNKPLIILFSSAAVYGNHCLKYKKKIIPISPYGKNKLQAENILKNELAKRNFKLIILRFYSIYGLGLKKQLTLWNFDGHFIPLAEIEPSSPDNRLNEGVVGPDGAYWVGTMQNNINADGTPKNITASTGRLYRCTADGSVVSVSEDKFGITNTFVWTDDGRLITADTLENALYSYRVNITGGALSDKKIILKDFDRGLPDGSCKDSEGYIWNCRVVGGSCVARVSAEGVVERVIELPCSWPTSCTFGGPDLKTLYVTSARFTMDSAHLVEFPHEGALMAVDTGFTGVLTNRFG